MEIVIRKIDQILCDYSTQGLMPVTAGLGTTRAMLRFIKDSALIIAPKTLIKAYGLVGKENVVTPQYLVKHREILLKYDDVLFLHAKPNMHKFMRSEVNYG